MSRDDLQGLANFLRGQDVVIVGGGGGVGHSRFGENDVILGLNYALNSYRSGSRRILMALDHRVDLARIEGEFDYRVISPYLFSTLQVAGGSAVHTVTLRNLGYSGFASDLNFGVYYGHTVAYAALQLLLYARVASVRLVGVSISYWILDWAAVRARLDSLQDGNNLTDLSLCMTQASQVAYALDRLRESGVEVRS